SAASSLPDFDRRVGRNEVEELDDLDIPHADAADRARPAHLGGVRRAVDVDVSAHRIDIAQAVAPYFAAREPQDAGQDPVAAGVLGMELGRPHLTGRPATHEHHAERLPGADLGTHDVAATWCAQAA